MTRKTTDYPSLIKELGLSREDLARSLGIGLAMVNRWENGMSKPSKLVKARFDVFCGKMIKQGKLAKHVGCL